MPPVAVGNVTGSIALPLSHTWLAIVFFPNDGAVSAATWIVRTGVDAPKAVPCAPLAPTGLPVTTVVRDIRHWNV